LSASDLSTMLDDMLANIVLRVFRRRTITSTERNVVVGNVEEEEEEKLSHTVREITIVTDDNDKTICRLLCADDDTQCKPCDDVNLNDVNITIDHNGDIIDEKGNVAISDIVKEAYKKNKATFDDDEYTKIVYYAIVGNAPKQVQQQQQQEQQQEEEEQ
jgi:hypothetical protein